MSEALERVRGVSQLPLFPLSVVLFPGAPIPLHIFESRYRQMMDDIRDRDNLFGLSYFDPSTSGGLEIPRVGHVGCVADVTESQPLPDGRSNILAVGLIRYRVEEYIDDAEPYLVARVSFFEDEDEESAAQQEYAEQVSSLFLRIAQSVRLLNDERVALPELPETQPEQLSFLVAAAMELEPEVKQELLEMRFTSERLRRLKGLLDRAVGSYEERARVHGIAKGNGHSGKTVKFE